MRGRMLNRATKEELRQEITELRNIGGQLSNVAHNIWQRGGKPRIDAEERAILGELYQKWDLIKRRERP